MELLFAALGGTLAGLAARYVLPGRGTHGSVLLPAIGTMVAAVVWVTLTWLGWKWNGGWIWWVTLVVSGLVCVGVDLFLSRRRALSDRRMLHALTKTGAPRSS